MTLGGVVAPDGGVALADPPSGGEDEPALLCPVGWAGVAAGALLIGGGLPAAAFAGVPAGCDKPLLMAVGVGVAAGIVTSPLAGDAPVRLPLAVTAGVESLLEGELEPLADDALAEAFAFWLAAARAALAAVQAMPACVVLSSGIAVPEVVMGEPSVISEPDAAAAAAGTARAIPVCTTPGDPPEVKPAQSGSVRHRDIGQVDIRHRRHGHSHPRAVLARAASHCHLVDRRVELTFRAFVPALPDFLLGSLFCFLAFFGRQRPAPQAEGCRQPGSQRGSGQGEKEHDRHDQHPLGRAGERRNPPKRRMPASSAIMPTMPMPLIAVRASESRLLTKALARPLLIISIMVRTLSCQNRRRRGGADVPPRAGKSGNYLGSSRTATSWNCTAESPPQNRAMLPVRKEFLSST